MVAAGLLLRSFWDLLNVQLGFSPQTVMIVRTRLPAPNDPNNDKYATAAQETPFLRELIRKCTLLPGVQEIAIGDTASIPLDQSLRDLKVISEGQFFFSIEGRNVQSDQVLRQTIFTCSESHYCGGVCLMNRITITLRKLP